MGLAAAWRLTRDGLSVCIVDQGQESWGATAASGAMLGVFGEITGSNDPDLAFRRLGRERFQSWLLDIAAVVPDPPQIVEGTFVIAGARRPGDSAALEAIELAARTEGTTYETVSPSDVPGLRPSPDWPVVRAGFLANEGAVDIREFSKVTTRALLALGVTVVAGKVDRLRSRATASSEAVLSDGTTLAAAEIVLCTGAGTSDLLARSGLSSGILGVWPAKGVSVTLVRRSAQDSPALPHTIRTPNRSFACGLHLVPRKDQALYLGATNRAARSVEALGGASVHEVMTLLSTATAEIDTELQRWDLCDVGVGYRPLSADGRPLLGRVCKDVVVATGGYRNGVLLAAVMADDVADILAGRPNRHVALDPGRRSTTESPQTVLSAAWPQLMELMSEDPFEDWRGWLGHLLDGLVTEVGAASDEPLEAFMREVSAAPRVELVPEALIQLVGALNAARARS